MSSARGQEGRLKDDYYVTPQWFVTEFLEQYLKHYNLPKSTMIHDPCAGGCVVNEMSYPTVLEKFGFTNIITSDIREDSRAMIKADYLKIPNFNPEKVVITNPPFNFSVPITMKAIAESKATIVLQRLNWIGSDWRKQFWKTSPLKHVYAHNKRASFTPDGRKDSVEYAHFVFEKGFIGDTRFTLIL